jgi:hypothetical protein
VPDHDDPPGLIRNDPESEATLPGLAETIEYELRSQIAMRHDPNTQEGRETIAFLVADAVLDVFAVRERKEPRTSWAD